MTGLEPAASTTPTDVGSSSRALCQDTCSWGIFCPLFPRVPCLSVVKTVVRPPFERIPGGALSVEKRTEFFLLHPKICKWSALWSIALHCICVSPISNLSVTQTVVKIIARRISFCDAVDKEKGFENSGCNFESGLQSRAHIIGYNATKTKAMLPIFQSDLPPCSREILQGDTRSRHLLY